MVSLLLLFVVVGFEAAERRVSILIFGNDYELKDRRRLRNCPTRQEVPMVERC